MSESDPFDEGLVYRSELPLAWRQIADPAELDAEALNAGNEQTLRLLAAVEEFFPDIADEHGQSHEFARLELKLNLLLELVTQLLAAQRSLPPASPLRLNAHAVEWDHIGADPPKTGDRLLLEVYLSPEVPRPIRLPAQVLQVQAAAGEANVTAALAQLSELVVELLEKFIFRRHRRSIAHSRPKSRPNSD